MIEDLRTKLFSRVKKRRPNGKPFRVKFDFLMQGLEGNGSSWIKTLIASGTATAILYWLWDIIKQIYGITQ